MRKKFKKIYFILFFSIVILIFVFFVLYNKPFPILRGKITSFGWIQKEKEDSNSFTFAIAGDNHNNIELYNKIISNVNTSNASFFVDLGDSTRIGGASEYAESRKVLDNLKVPHHMVIGDHDTVGDGYNLWQQYYGPTYYSWDYENAHFIVLNNVVNENGFSEEQLSWLKKDLSDTSKKIKIIFLHRPPRCPLTDPEDLGFAGPQSEERINQFLDIAKKHKVNKMFAGHIHNFLNYSISGIPITVTGGAGGPIYNIPLIGRDGHHYVEVEVSDSDFKQKVIEL